MDFADYSVLAGNFAGTITVAAASTCAAPGQGKIELVINLETGPVKIDVNNADIAGYSVRSASGSTVPDADGAAPLQFYLRKDANEVTAGAIGTGVMFNGESILDIAWSSQERDAVFEYTRFRERIPIMG